MIEMISITIAMERTFMMIIKNINDNDRNDINDDSNDDTNNNNIMITELWSTTVITGMKCYPIKTKMYCRLFIPPPSRMMKIYCNMTRKLNIGNIGILNHFKWNWKYRMRFRSINSTQLEFYIYIYTLV